MAAGPSDQPKQFWIRNDKGTMWGPLTYATIELLVDNGAMPGKLQASRNGLDFVWPGRLPELRDALPQELWGDSSNPLPEEAGPATAAPGAAPHGPPVVGKPGSGPPRVGPPKVGPKVGPKVAPGKPAEAAAKPDAKPDAKPEPAAATPAAAPASAASGAAKVVTVPDGAGVPASGSLEDFPPFRIYYLAATANQTGRLTMNGIDASYEIFFKKGAPEAVRSSLDEEDLGSWLVEKGVLSKEKLAEARKAAGKFGGELLNALFGMQLLNPADAFKHIGEHAMSLLSKGLSQEVGTFSFDTKTAAPPTAMPLGDRWKIICDLVRGFTTDYIKKRLGRRMDAPIMKSGGRVEVSQLKLTPQEARCAVLFDGVRSLSQLVAAMPNEADTLVRTAFLLYRFEACSFADIGPEEPAKPEPAAAAEEPALDLATEAVESKPAAAAEEPAIDLATEAAEDKPIDLATEVAEDKPIDLATEAVEAGPAAVPPPEEDPLELDLEALTGKKAPAPEPPKAAPKRPEPPKAPPPKIEPARPAAARPPVAPARPPPVVGAKPGAAPGKPPVVAPARPAPAPAKPPAAAAAAPASGNPGNDLAALQAFFDGLKGKNHFEVLGVGEGAATPEVKKAYFQFAKWFHPDTAQGAAPEVGKLKADIFARVNEANSVLADEKSRAAYLEELQAGAEKLDASKIFASEETFQKACIQLKARKYPEALKMFDEAIALYEKEGEYHVWRGWARFLAAADKKGTRDAALKEIDHGLSLSPRCALGPFFKGQIHKLLGDGATAQKLFRETLELDPNNIEAQREVRQK